MNLCIDARPMQNAHRSRGVGVLVANLLRELAGELATDEVTLIVQQGAAFPPVFLQERRICTYRLLRPNRFNWLADHFLLPGLVRRSGADLFLATDLNSYLLPGAGGKAVSMVYDLIPFIFPEVMASQPLSVRYGWRANFEKLCSSDMIIAISAATRDDLVRLLDVRRERVRIIYPGIDHTLFNAANATDPLRREEVLGTCGVSGRFLLYVGDSEWRKNLRRCLEAFKEIDRELKLVLVGRRACTDQTLHGWIAELGLQERVITPGFVADADLPLLYGAAEAFLFPSLYEGFGLPVVEAMACGCPVITSAISSLPEVAGSAGLLVDPYSVPAIREAVRQVLEDSDLRRRMVTDGITQAAGFSWQRTAQETASLLRDVAA